MFDDLQKAFGDVALRHGITHEELGQAISTWMATGPAYVPGAPEIHNPGVLPMAPDEPGDTLFASGVVRSTSGKPLPGAVTDPESRPANALAAAGG
ncbi:hypothetical protein ACIQVC_42125 [Streptomyces sp. NPDC101112]|uniref:hypothetical protein n=1 Tax=Streptomyces sp. NPDC101112 TaxID=3366105 RepID=UPI00381BBC91